MISQVALGISIFLLAVLIAKFVRFEGTYFLLMRGNLVKLKITRVRNEADIRSATIEFTSMKDYDEKQDPFAALDDNFLSKGQYYLACLYVPINGEKVDDLSPMGLILYQIESMFDFTDLGLSGTGEVLMKDATISFGMGALAPDILLRDGYTWYNAVIDEKPTECSKEII